jgi:hypothetical protein
VPVKAPEPKGSGALLFGSPIAKYVGRVLSSPTAKKSMIGMLRPAPEFTGFLSAPDTDHTIRCYAEYVRMDEPARAAGLWPARPARRHRQKKTR